MSSYLNRKYDYDSELNDVFSVINELHNNADQITSYDKYFPNENIISNIAYNEYKLDDKDMISSNVIYYSDQCSDGKYTNPSSSHITEESDDQSVSSEVVEISNNKAVDEIPKYCVVCGEPTKCYHYDVPSCTGCKTFFRRCLITGKRYKCQYGGKCNIQKGDDCRGCRFERCLISGMNPSAIQYPAGVDVNMVVNNVKQLKRKIIEENRPIISKMLPAFSQTEERRIIDFLLYLEAKQRKLRESTYNPVYLYKLNMKELLERGTELSLADKFEKPPEWPLDTNTIIQRMIQCKIKKEEPTKCVEKCKRDNTPWRTKFFIPIDIILQIEMAKVLPVFNSLSINDKEVLLRHVVVSNMMLTQSFYSYLNHIDVIAYPNGFIPVKVDQGLGRLDQLKYDTHTRAVECIRRISLQPEHFVLLKALIYCQPSVDGLSVEGKQVVTEYYEKYSEILLHYLQNEMGSVSGASKYAEIISLISTYFHFAEKAKQIHLVHRMRNHRQREKCQVIVRDECMQ